MARMAHAFGVSFSNIPIINIRIEYVRYLNYLESDGLMQDLKREPGVLRTPYMIWLGFPEMFLTVLLQRTISGLEAYLGHAVHFELARRGKASRQTQAAVERAMSSTRGGAAEGLFNAAPALVDRTVAMRRSNRRLWGRTKLFYQQIRNPVFHGYQLEASSIPRFLETYMHLDLIYGWIDTWNNPNDVLPGFYDLLGRSPSSAKGAA